MSSMPGANKTEESDVPLTGQAVGSEEKDPHSLIASPISDCEDKPNKAFTNERDDNLTHKKITCNITPAMPRATNHEAIGLDEKKSLIHSNPKALHCDRLAIQCIKQAPCSSESDKSGEVSSSSEHGNNQRRRTRTTTTFIDNTQLGNVELMIKTKDVSIQNLFVWNENSSITVHEPAKCEIDYIQGNASYENLFVPLQHTPDVSLNVPLYEFKAFDAVIATIQSAREWLSLMINFLETLFEDFCRIKEMALAKIRVKHGDNSSFQVSISCNGFITGGKIASNNVMICLVIVRNLIFGTKRNSNANDVELTFDIHEDVDWTWRYEQHGEGKQLKQFSFSGGNFQPCSQSKETEIVSFSERPLVHLEAPGPRNYSNQISREETFNSAFNSSLPTPSLARHGFFWNGQHAQCYSCDSTHTIDDVAQSPESEIWHLPTCHLLNRNGGSRASLRQVVSDTPGRISDDVRDPPGQQSIYIPPGDVRVESYRLSTFNNYPVHSPMDRKALAKGGFYFTGYSDRVKCFACGRTVERWEPTDNPLDLTWHKDSCPHPRGGECGNVPSTNLFARFQGSGSGFNPRNISLEVLEQRDPQTGEYVRTTRFPTDLPERVRRGGGSFEIGPNNNITIQTGGITQNPGNGEPRMQVTTSVNHRPPRQWRMANVISSDHRRFLNNLFLNRELDRLVSFARWPTGRPTVSPTDLARNGFFYLGDMDRTQCFSCAGVLRNWTANDSARVEHRTHFPNCRLVLGTETRNVPVPMQPESMQDRQRRFPCRFPSNPHMRSEATRLDTFDSRWPMGRMAATPEEIARAGFFFLGERDRVKCWYCNGGLQHWDYDDAPWVEHAKWFPNCQFLLSVKGQHFVYRHLTTSAYLSRPIIARQEGATVDPSEQGSNEPPEDIPPPSPGSAPRGPTPPPTIVDPREEMRKKEEQVDNALKESEIVKNVLAMGFSADVVRIVLKEKLESGEASNTADIYDTVSGLLEAVMQKESEEEQRRQNEAASLPGPSSMMSSFSSVYSSMTTDPNPSSLGPSPGSGKYNVSLMDEDDDRDMYGAEPLSGMSSLNSVTRAKQIEGGSEESSASLQEALNKIEEERMCKICFSNQADMVFVPCGHMCCCRNCTEAIRHCPVCRVRIEKAIKTYLE